MKEYLKLAAVALIAGLVAGLVVGWLVSNQPAVLGNTRFPNGIQPQVITVNATSTMTTGEFIENEVFRASKQLTFNNSSTTLCSYENPLGLGASTTMQRLVLDF